MSALASANSVSKSRGALKIGGNMNKSILINKTNTLFVP